MIGKEKNQWDVWGLEALFFDGLGYLKTNSVEETGFWEGEANHTTVSALLPEDFGKK
ncbi:MAG: hypothetical protein ABF379_13245 [Akkermansiaceae bacterium]